MSRRRILAGILPLAVLCGLLFLRRPDPLGAALGRICPGMDETAVVAAMGRPERPVGDTIGAAPPQRVSLTSRAHTLTHTN
jgi:hypothetical protein